MQIMKVKKKKTKLKTQTTIKFITCGRNQISLLSGVSSALPGVSSVAA